jgi:integrase
VGAGIQAGQAIAKRRLSLYGLRRGEVLGQRWSDIDLRAGTLTVNQARVLVKGSRHV